MESDELVKIIEVLESKKIQSFKGMGIEVHFSHEAFAPTYGEQESELSDPDSNKELLFMSSGVKGVIREQRK